MIAISREIQSLKNDYLHVSRLTDNNITKADKSNSKALERIKAYMIELEKDLSILAELHNYKKLRIVKATEVA